MLVGPGSMGALHERLHGGLWHTTRPDRIPSIFSSGSLMVEPDISETERWGRPDHPPFVRKIGGVSLFDFLDFDPGRYSETHPLSSWQHFVPYRKSWGGAVWLRIDRAAVAQGLLSTDEVMKRWTCDGNHRYNVMPRIEAAHIGDLPISAISSAFLTWDGGHEVRDFDVHMFDPFTFSLILAEWQCACGLTGVDEAPPSGSRK